MIRKLLLPAVAVALLGGCVSAGYSYRQGSGDYYHGTPSVEYRYHAPGYGWPYPYGYYGPSSYGGYRYGYPYGYPYGYRQYYGDPYRNYYGNPYGNPYYYRRPVPRLQPRIDPTPDVDRSHWRNLDGLRRRNRIDPGETSTPRAIVAPQPQPRFNPAPHDDDGSALGGRVRRAKEGVGGEETTP